MQHNSTEEFLNPTQDALFMRRALHLARQGKATVSPNPMVGCVIVYEGKIIGEGYHKEYGKAHAEVNALASVKEEELALLRMATVYVTLEPCAHYGNTPPCALKLVEVGVKRVVVGCRDSDPRVAGKGIELLKKGEIEVLEGVLEEECLELNRVFFFSLKHQRPYVFLKWAMSNDGYMGSENRAPLSISGLASRTHAHFLRSFLDALLVGAGTVLSDNPSLDTRLVSGKNPLRVVLHSQETFTGNENIFCDGRETLVCSTSEKPSFLEAPSFSKLAWEVLPRESFLQHVLSSLHQRRIRSVLVEGGKFTLDSFLEEKLWEEAIVYVGKTDFFGGIKAPAIADFPKKSYKSGKDDVILYSNFDKTDNFS